MASINVVIVEPKARATKLPLTIKRKEEINCYYYLAMVVLFSIGGQWEGLFHFPSPFLLSVR